MKRPSIQLTGLRNRHLLALDLLFFSLTPAVALGLRTDGRAVLNQPNVTALILTTLIFLAVKVAILYKGKLYTHFWRYASIDELAQIIILCSLALLINTLAFFAVMRPFGLVARDFPRSIPLLDGLLSIMVVGGIRFCVPLIERWRRPAAGLQESKRTLVVGAGSTGVAIAREMQHTPNLHMRPVGFVDDANEKQGVQISGVPVLGRIKDIPDVARRSEATQAIIALPQVSGKVIREVVSTCEKAGVQTKIVPKMTEILGGGVSIKHMRDVEIEDLLRREPVQTDITSVKQLAEGKRVLVTGGGGSIGSELCRQIMHFNPETLVILGHGENSVFEIYSELERLQTRGAFLAGDDAYTHQSTRICTAIADIRAPERLEAVLNEFHPQLIFHCAAHKHVPLMEVDPAEAVTNNVLGTRNLLEASLKYGVEHFVMISTDKAVNPSSVMGATKRVAELLVHSAAMRSSRPYVAVRFGNVLGSRGSVLLTFREQIASGGPITVTHPDVKRYFMTIPEAVQLVLQAATLGSGGEVFMLDMGEPIKIADMARDVIELSGLRLDQDIDIAYTGLRPGEKLFEELFLEGEDYKRTHHDKIYIVGNATAFVPLYLDDAIKELGEAASCGDRSRLLSCLRRLVPEYHSPASDTPRTKTLVLPRLSKQPEPIQDTGANLLTAY